MPVQVVIGCAGSLKTTDIVHNSIHLTNSSSTSRKTIQILASNTYSISSIVKLFKSTYNITFKREKTTNHYIHLKRGICVSTFDAWINHIQPDKSIRPDNFHQKIDTLNNLEYIDISSKNFDSRITHIFIDDAQDLNRIKTIFITKLIHLYPSIYFAIYGDILQSVFYTDYFPLRTFPLQKTSMIEYRNINHRCPEEHICFLNIIARPYFQQYELPVMCSSNNKQADIHKPFIFTHPSTTSSNKCNEIARYVSNLVEIVSMNDPDIQPNDIAILMSRESDNTVFKHLSIPINDVWRRVMSYRGSTAKSKKGYYSVGVENVDHHTVASCIHNIRSLSFKLVILLGMTDKSIPKETDVGRLQEIVSQSLFYTAFTRSKKYLMIGMNYDTPSSYMFNIKDHPETFYQGWEEPSQSLTIYDKLPRCQKEPNWNVNIDILNNQYRAFHLCRSTVIIDTIKTLMFVHKNEQSMNDFLEAIQKSRFIDNENDIINNNQKYKEMYLDGGKNDGENEFSIHTIFLQKDVNRSISLFFDISISWEEKMSKHRRSIWNTAILYNQVYNEYITKLETFIDCESNYFF
tara:strand:+ start:675 stop:2399 length:1725 start_codon:yes stop_codon:yes gene_type:complete